MLKRKITKEEYDMVIANNPSGYVKEELRDHFFSVAQLCGYGVYSPCVSEQNGECYLTWEQGSSCD